MGCLQLGNYAGTERYQFCRGRWKNPQSAGFVAIDLEDLYFEEHFPTGFFGLTDDFSRKRQPFGRVADADGVALGIEFDARGSRHFTQYAHQFGHLLVADGGGPDKRLFRFDAVLAMFFRRVLGYDT